MEEVTSGSPVCEWIARKSHAGAPPQWGPRAMFLSQAGRAQTCNRCVFWLPQVFIATEDVSSGS
eukprot:4892459-Pyramimonas_sp.AAC.1